ncbi:MAG: hypothetical protein NTX61_16870 [Bacteroidetes bacterium]|nr:hypothetical protein [Bacteroidota bacterium]
MLNPDYYQILLDKYSVKSDCHKTALLTTGIIWQNYLRQNIHFNFPKIDCVYEKTVNRLYKKLSNVIFRSYADFPPFGNNDKVKRIGGTSKEIFIVRKIENNYAFLVNTKDDSFEMLIAYDNLLKKYLPIKQNATEKTLLKYKDYFSKINELGFLPTYFSKKIVLITTKTMWDKLDKKNNIPSIYLPNTKEENQTTLKSISALEDCIAYVTPKYEVSYEQVLRKGKVIDTIMVCNTDENSIPQIIQDQTTYKFKLIVLTNDYEPQRDNGLIFWDWKKEEIELIEKL